MKTKRSPLTHRSQASIALIALVGGLTGCETPGESRLAVYAPEDATLIWDRVFPTENVSVTAISPDTLRILGSDNCWDAVFLSDFDRQTGRKLRDLPIEPSSGIVEPRPELDPPTSCPDGAQERVTLSSGEIVDICRFAAGDELLLVRNADTGEERVQIRIMRARDLLRFGDQVLIVSPYEHHIAMFSLVTGEALWSWTTPDEYTYVAGSDAERLYIWQEATRETFALSLAAGTVVWQKNLGCDWVSLSDGLLFCGETLRDSMCEE